MANCGEARTTVGNDVYNRPSYGVRLEPDCTNFAVNTQALSQDTAGNKLGHQWGNEVGFTISNFLQYSSAFAFVPIKFQLNARTTSSNDYGRSISARASLASILLKVSSKPHAFRFNMDLLSLGNQTSADILPISPKNLRNISFSNMFTPSIGALYMYTPAKLGIRVSAMTSAPLTDGRANYDDQVDVTTETNGKKTTKTVTKTFSTSLKLTSLHTEAELFYAPFINKDGGWFRNTRLFVTYQTQQGWWSSVGANPAQIRDTGYSSRLFLFGISSGYMGQNIEPAFMAP